MNNIVFCLYSLFLQIFFFLIKKKTVHLPSENEWSEVDNYK